MTDFVLLIQDWYRLNARNLPWRETKNPYFIWLSEVILQQTRVDQGMNYYFRFVEKFPTVHDLANAEQEEVLLCWQGLGYYSRARNLHATAKEIVRLYNGEFPPSYEKIIALKGIGPYTAAAISSFAFDLPHAVVDGNVYRILSRYFGIDEAIDSTKGKKAYQQLADELIPHTHPGMHNQAIMEFGAIQCKPKNPLCEECVLQKSCASFGTDHINTRPFKEKKTKVRNRYFHYFHISRNNQTAWTHRNSKDIWQHLYEFPMIETESEQFPESLGKSGLIPSYSTKHILSHQHIHAYFYELDMEPELKDVELKWIKETEELPTHRLMEKYLENDKLRMTNDK